LDLPPKKEKKEAKEKANVNNKKSALRSRIL